MDHLEAGDSRSEDGAVGSVKEHPVANADHVAFDRKARGKHESSPLDFEGVGNDEPRSVVGLGLHGAILTGTSAFAEPLQLMAVVEALLVDDAAQAQLLFAGNLELSSKSRGVAVPGVTDFIGELELSPEARGVRLK